MGSIAQEGQGVEGEVRTVQGRPLLCVLATCPVRGPAERAAPVAAVPTMPGASPPQPGRLPVRHLQGSIRIRIGLCMLLLLIGHTRVTSCTGRPSISAGAQQSPQHRQPQALASEQQQRVHSESIASVMKMGVWHICRG